MSQSLTNGLLGLALANTSGGLRSLACFHTASPLEGQVALLLDSALALPKTGLTMQTPAWRPSARRLQRRAEAEERRGAGLAAELAAERRNLADVNEFLTNELKARALTAAAREARLEAATRELLATRASAEVRLRLDRVRDPACCRAPPAS